MLQRRTGLEHPAAQLGRHRRREQVRAGTSTVPLIKRIHGKYCLYLINIQHLVVCPCIDFVFWGEKTKITFVEA